MIRPALLAAFLILPALTSPALAQGRPSTDRLSCAQAAGIVRAQGAIVLGTGGFTYDRFVSDRSFCQITEIAIPAFAPALDTPQCFVGYRCREPSSERFRDD
ncbi:MAG TPA: hypothetical protein VIL65_02655 [Beijerinckiaceae bacterium]|jgi:hypothetical protein